ncbi:serine hydrolase domain-containing protein [Intrasporangium sp.]|uniref:serine hydrolase domain-containing protein n=1 Tax=Intrasporangium sp. TaxID=1925024 RepID=UPI0029397820|nr:serine hydrolase domain-containing protein [Intrasporangium sp.]MDV3223316.1 beta-lactamase family protein [Intrasporangium sp.]
MSHATGRASSPSAREEGRLRSSLERIAHRRAARRHRSNSNGNGRTLPPPQVLVRAPGWEFEFGDVDRPFHAASSGKLMTAALIARLVERGRFGFDSPIGAVLPTADVARLPAVAGVDVAGDVAVEHLLTHTSGLPDFFEPPRGHETAASATAAVVDRNRRWSPAELLDEARRLPAVGPPGERFHYSDTNYVLLGRLAEEAEGETLSTLLRRHIFEPSGMERSSTPYDATLIADDLSGLDVAPFWIGRHELSRAHSVSLDWAGGNVVGPPDDFVRFQQALHGGRLISPEHVAHLARPRNRYRRGIHYGAGTMTLRFGELLPPLMRGLPGPVGHLGFWATHVFHYPEQDAQVVLNFHSDRHMNQSFRIHAGIARLLSALR